MRGDVDPRCSTTSAPRALDRVFAAYPPANRETSCEITDGTLKDRVSGLASIFAYIGSTCWNRVHGGCCLEEFWLCAMSFLTEKRLDERLIKLLEMLPSPSLSNIVCVSGPTDAGLIVLALREKCFLLTDDSRLFAWIDQHPTLRVSLAENMLQGPASEV